MQTSIGTRMWITLLSNDVFGGLLWRCVSMPKPRIPGMFAGKGNRSLSKGLEPWERIVSLDYQLITPMLYNIHYNKLVITRSDELGSIRMVDFAVLDSRSYPMGAWAPNLFPKEIGIWCFWIMHANVKSMIRSPWLVGFVFNVFVKS